MHKTIPALMAAAGALLLAISPANGAQPEAYGYVEKPYKFCVKLDRLNPESAVSFRHGHSTYYPIMRPGQEVPRNYYAHLHAGSSENPVPYAIHCARPR